MCMQDLIDSIPESYHEGCSISTKDITRSLCILQLASDRKQSSYIFKPNYAPTLGQPAPPDFRRKNRKWHMDLYNLPEFIRVVDEGGKKAALEVRDALRQCRLLVLLNLNLKKRFDNTGEKIRKRLEFLKTLREMEEYLSTEENDLAKELAASIFAPYRKTPIDFLIKKPALVGKAGNASKTISGQRGYFTRVLDDLIPDMSERPSTITKLLNYAGLDISVNSVSNIIRDREGKNPPPEFKHPLLS